jgi:hypothetical protein
MAETPYKPRKTLMTPEEVKKLKGKKSQGKGKNPQKPKPYYKPRKTLMTPEEVKKAQTKKPDVKNIPQKKQQAQNPQAQNKITKTPPENQKAQEKPKNVAGGYSKRITYPKEELKPLEESGSFQKGSGKIGGYVKPKTISYNSTKGVLWALLIIFVVAVAFGVLYFTNSLNNLKIGFRNENI